MTSATADLATLRHTNWGDLATVRTASNLVELIRPAPGTDGLPVPTVWHLCLERNNERRPSLMAGVGVDVGFLRWFPDSGRSQVPAGTVYRNGGSDYQHGGHPHGCYNGEEIAVEIVYAAVAQFVATGERPGCLRWIDDSDVPNYRTQLPADAPLLAAMRDAVGFEAP